MAYIGKRPQDTFPATNAITTVTIADNAVTSVKIAENNITSRELAANTIATGNIADNAVDGTKIAQNSILTRHIDDGQVGTAQIAADAITGAKVADDAIDSEHFVDGSIDTAHIADDQVTLAKMAGLARGKIIYGDSSGNPAALTIGSNGQVLTSDGTDISWGTDAVLSTENVQDIAGAMFSSNTETNITATYEDGDGTIDLVVGTLNQDTTGSAATLTTGRTIGMTGDVVWTSPSFNGSGNVTAAATIQANAVESAMIAENNITTREIAANTIATGNIADNAVDGTKIAQNSILTRHIDDGQVTTDQIAANTIATANIADNAVDGTKIAQNSILTKHIDDAQVTTAQLGADAVTGAKIADDAIDSEHFVDGSIDTAHIADDQVTAAKLANTAVTAASYGSSSAIPVITVDAQGRITGATTAATSSTLTIAADSGSNDTVTVGTDTLTFEGTANEIETTVSNNKINVGLPTNVTIAGNLTVAGTTTEVSSTTINVADPLVSLATSNNAADAVDIGIYGLYDTSGSQDLYSGLFRDASDSGKWKLFKDNQAAPTTTVNTSGTGYATGTLVANLEGNVTGNVTGNTSGTAATVTGAAQSAITSLGTLTALTVDNLTVNGNTITADSGALNLTPASGSAIVLDGTINVDAGVVTGATSITSTAFVGNITGNVTGNTSGTAATVTGGTQASITTAANLTTVGTIGTGVWQGTAIASGYIAADAITGAKIADDAINSEHYTDGSIDTAHIADDQVTLAKMAGIARGKIIYGDSSGNPAVLAAGSNGQVLKSDGTDISWGADSGLSTEEVQDIAGGMFSSNTETGITATYQDGDGTIDLEIGAGAIVNSMLADDAVGADELAANSVVSASIVNGSIVSADIAANTIATSNVADNAIDGTKIASNSILTRHIDDNQITGDQLADDLVLSGTGAIRMPDGTTGQRPGSAAAGMFRYNTTLGKFEGYTDSWGEIGGGGAGAFSTDTMTGDNSDTTLTLSQAPAEEADVIVFIDGVFQAHDTYAVSGTTLTFSTAPATGRVVTAYTVKSAVSGTNLTHDAFSGDGSDTTFTLSIAPVHENNTQVYVDGVYQFKGTYSVSGTTLTFSTAPPNGTAIEVMTMNQTDINVPVDDTITTAKIADNAVTAAKIASGTLTDQVAGISSAADATAITIDSSENSAFSGDVTVAASKKLISTSSSSGDYIRLYAGGGTGKWDMYGSGANLRISDNDSAGLVDIDTALTVDGAATFNSTITLGNTSGATITMNDTDTSQEDFAFVLGANALAMRKTSNSNDIMRLDLTNERVGIGTTSPSTDLDISPSSGAAELRIAGAEGQEASIRLYADEGDDAADIKRFLTDTSGNLKIQHYAGSAFVDSMTINSAGVVSVGKVFDTLHTDFAGNAYSTANDGILTIGSVTGDHQAVLMLGNQNIGDGSEIGSVTFGSQSTKQASITGGYNAGGNGHLRFETNSGNTFAERMRIKADGEMTVGTSNDMGSRFASHETRSDHIAITADVINSSYASSVLDVACNRVSNDAYNMIKCQMRGHSNRLLVTDNGDVENTNNSYGAISDQRLKTNIADASSQWNDIKAVKVRKFKYGMEPERGFRLGVISQELEASGMNGLVKERDADEYQIAYNSDLNGQKVKRVKYSVLYMKAIKALQEAMTRIETLEAKVTTLEG